MWLHAYWFGDVPLCVKIAWRVTHMLMMLAFIIHLLSICYKFYFPTYTQVLRKPICGALMCQRHATDLWQYISFIFRRIMLRRMESRNFPSPLDARTVFLCNREAALPVLGLPFLRISPAHVSTAL